MCSAANHSLVDLAIAIMSHDNGRTEGRNKTRAIDLHLNNLIAILLHSDVMIVNVEEMTLKVKIKKKSLDIYEITQPTVLLRS